MDKTKDSLDALLAVERAQPVGIGYAQVLVHYDNYKILISKLFDAGYDIISVSWFEYVDSVDKPNLFGGGGYRSQYYPGWFPDLEETDKVWPTAKRDVNQTWLENFVDHKALITNSEELLTFQKRQIYPAFGLDVPGDWKSKP